MADQKIKLRSWHLDAINELDRLIETLSMAYLQAVRTDDLGCAELYSALRRAQAIRGSLKNRSLDEAQWQRLTWVLEFLLKVAKQFCSFISFIHAGEEIVGDRGHYKKIATEREYIPA